MLFLQENPLARLKEEFNTDEKLSTLLLLLLITDSIFIILHFLPLTPWFQNPLLNINQDQGYAEIYMYLKELWIIILLIFIMIKTKTIGYSAWILLFLYILLDDSLEIHETLGGSLAASLGFPSFMGLRPQDFGELAVSSSVASVIFGLLLLFYLIGTKAYKDISLNIFLLFLALVFFGVFIDMLNMMIQLGWEVDYIFAAIEDGGELMVMSLLVYYIYLVKIRT